GLRQLTRQQPGTADLRRTSGHCPANRESIATRGEMVMRLRLLSLLLPTFLITPSVVRAAEDPYAAQLFRQNCASCHELAAAAPGARIPPVSVLKAMTPTAILRALESGIMKPQAAVLSTNERQAVANFLGTAATVERR